VKERSVLNPISNLMCHCLLKITEGAYKKLYLHGVCKEVGFSSDAKSQVCLVLSCIL